MLLIIGWTIVVIGMFFVLSGSIALLRFPDFYTKIHGASVIESCGAPIVLVGLACLQSNVTSSFKLIIMAAIVLILCPASTFAIARASTLYKIDKDGRIK